MQPPAIAALMVLAAVLAGCQTTAREKSPELVLAERQTAAVAALQGVPPAAPASRSIGACAYEWGAQKPAAWTTAIVGGAPLFAVSEAAQILALPVYWGRQDAIVDATVDLYRAGPGYHRVQDALAIPSLVDPAAPRPHDPFAVPRGGAPAGPAR